MLFTPHFKADGNFLEIDKCIPVINLDHYEHFMFNDPGMESMEVVNKIYDQFMSDVERERLIKFYTDTYELLFRLYLKENIAINNINDQVVNNISRELMAMIAETKLLKHINRFVETHDDYFCKDNHNEVIGNNLLVMSIFLKFMLPVFAELKRLMKRRKVGNFVIIVLSAKIVQEVMTNYFDFTRRWLKTHILRCLNDKVPDALSLLPLSNYPNLTNIPLLIEAMICDLTSSTLITVNLTNDNIFEKSGSKAALWFGDIS